MTLNFTDFPLPIGILASFAIGMAIAIVIGMALRSRKLKTDVARIIEKAEVAEHGICLLTWHTGKSREQLLNDCRYRMTELDEAAYYRRPVADATPAPATGSATRSRTEGHKYGSRR